MPPPRRPATRAARRSGRPAAESGAGAVTASDPDVERFLLTLQARRSPRTVDAYRRDLARSHAFAAAPVADVTTEGLEAWLASMRADGLAASTIARRVSAVRAYFRHLVLIGTREENPAASLQLPRRARTLPRALSPAETERLIDAATGTSPRALRDRALVELLYGAGLRVSEAVGLEKSGVAIDERVVRVLGKGGKERLVPLGRPAAEAVRRYLALGRPHLDRRYRPELSSTPAAAHSREPARSSSCASSPTAPGSSQGASIRISSVTRSPRTCSRAAPTSAPCRRCSAMPTSAPPSDIRMSRIAVAATSISRRIRTPAGASGRSTDRPRSALAQPGSAGEREELGDGRLVRVDQRDVAQLSPGPRLLAVQVRRAPAARRGARLARR